MDYACSSTLKTICFLVFILVGSTSAQQNTRCPFDLMYHFGDGVFDTGNAIASMPYGPKLPAARLPYGETYLNRPTGRWSDGLTDIDYGARGLGFPDVLSYLEGDAEKSNAVMFAVARSPVLDRAFFTARRLRIPPYAGSLNIQMSWFKKYLATVCFTPEDCADKLSNSIIIFGDVEANDITYALIQGKSFEEVHTYVKYVTEAQVNAARELIRLGATRIVVPGNAPIGCYPFILTELATNETNAYDEIGCLRSVNDLMIYKNNDLRVAIDDLAAENPDIFLYYADFYSTEYAMLRNQSINGPYSNVTLQACCGEGGKYNYNSRRFCGAPGVESCADPTQYFFWDGIHLTQEANRRLSIVLQRGALGLFNCTVPPLSQTWSYM